MKTRKTKKNRKTKRMKGGILNYKFSILQQYIQNSYKTSIYMPHLIRIIETENKRTQRDRAQVIALSESDWGILIKKAYQDEIRFIFGDSPMEQRLRSIFNYRRPDTFPTYAENTDAFPLKQVYDIILRITKKKILMDDVLAYIEFLKTRPIEPIHLSERDWHELIAECYHRHRIYFVFNDSPLQRYLNKSFDYPLLDNYFGYLDKIEKDGKPMPNLIDLIHIPARPTRPAESVTEGPTRPAESVPARPTRNISRYEPAEEPAPKERHMPKPVRTLSISQPAQGNQNSCFAHAATLLIFHNMFNDLLERMTPTQITTYEAKDCNSYLNTTNPFPSYEVVSAQCGDVGATRICLYLYIYNMLVKKFGCNYGHSIECILYYLNTSFQPNMFESSPDGIIIDALIEPIYKRVIKDDFAVSEVDMDFFYKLPEYKLYLKQYFKYYYARLHVTKHDVVIAEIKDDKYIGGKDTMTGTDFLIPFSEFHPKGKIVLPGEILHGLLSIAFLYDTSKLAEFDPAFSELLKDKQVK